MRHRTAAVCLTLFCCLLFAGLSCAPLMRSVGLDEQEIADIHGIAVDELDAVKDVGRVALSEVITAVIAGVGAVTSAVLARMLTTERKISKAVIAGVEAGDTSETKAAIQKAAVAAGVEDPPHKRVQSLTSAAG